MSASITTRTGASRRSAVPPMRWQAPRATSSTAASTGAASIGATRCAPAEPPRTKPCAPTRAWQAAGVRRADGEAFPQPQANARLWVPVKGGPAFLIGQNFLAVRSYNPSMNYALAIAHLSDRLRGMGPFVQPFPGSERTPTLAELQELQRRLTAAGFDTGGMDGRVGNDTMRAVLAYQKKTGLKPADGYAGLRVLERLRAGP